MLLRLVQKITKNNHMKLYKAQYQGNITQLTQPQKQSTIMLLTQRICSMMRRHASDINMCCRELPFMAGSCLFQDFQSWKFMVFYKTSPSRMQDRDFQKAENLDTKSYWNKVIDQQLLVILFAMPCKVVPNLSVCRCYPKILMRYGTIYYAIQSGF